MIRLSRLNGKPIILNALLIESIEETPDTIITLTTGKKITVLEKADVIIDSATRFLREIGLVGATIKSADSEGSQGAEK
ncbi:MAG: flagellar protein FlbD [Paenibacillaceae bacterium]|jgi:flagellar protein FlbD|nr:flagellar protein FlbD [Paenibacillaceae bacterium]